MLSFPMVVLGYGSLIKFCKICLHILCNAITSELMTEIGYLLSADHRKLDVGKTFK